MTDLPRVVAQSDIGSVALVELWRKNRLIEINVKLGELPEETFVERKNIKKEKKEIFLNSLNLSINKTKENKGVIVFKVAAISNLKIGDIITEVNREIITDTKSFVDLVEKIKSTGRNSLLLKIIREEKSLWITIQFIK